MISHFPGFLMKLSYLFSDLKAFEKHIASFCSSRNGFPTWPKPSVGIMIRTDCPYVYANICVSLCMYIYMICVYIYTVYLHTHPHPLKSMEDLGQVTTRKGMLDSTFSRPTIITTDWFITRNGLKVSEALWDPLFLNQILLQINPLEKG